MRRIEQISRRLKLRDLHYLLTVSQAGSMAKAALELSVSQPVISKIIADMEHTLGVRLLDRSPRGVEPTIYGRKLLASGYAMFDELRHAVIEIDHQRDPAAGELSIGSNEASALGVVPTAIARLRRDHPRLFVRVTIANSVEEQRQALAERRIEFAVGRVLVADAGGEFETETLFEQRLYVVSGAHNPWARRRRVRLADLMDCPWIMPSLTSAAGQLAADVFRGSGLPVPQAQVTTSSFLLNHRLLEEGPFLAFLPASVLPALTKNSTLRIVRVDLPDQSSPVGIIKLRNRRLGPVAELFLGAVRDVARTVHSAGD